MTFNQFDIKFNRFKYIVEDSGIRVIKKSLFKSDEQSVAFENIGSKIIKVKEKKRPWLIISGLFFVLALTVFIDRLKGDKVGEGAEIFWLIISAIFFIIYSIKGKNSVILFKDGKADGIEFMGTNLFEKRLNKFIDQLLQRRDEYLGKKYSFIDGLTADENMICINAGVQLADGLFLKNVTKHPIEKLIFENEYSDVEKPGAICSMTTEKIAREMIATHRERFIGEGKYIFITRFSGDEYHVGLIASTNDPYKVMEFSETNGINYDIETKDIISKYKKWDQQFGIKPVGIGFDFCECEIINKDIDYKSLAEEVYEFCPDVVEQGTETVEHLEKEIKDTGRIFLWWD